MHASYDDITSRIGTAPIWFDEHAVPRYCAFEPKRSASIHIGEIALAEVTCQGCQRKFCVAFSAVNFREQTIAEAIRSGALPTCTKGTRKRILVEDLVAWVRTWKKGSVVIARSLPLFPVCHRFRD